VKKTLQKHVMSTKLLFVISGWDPVTQRPTSCHLHLSQGGENVAIDLVPTLSLEASAKLAQGEEIVVDQSGELA